VLYLRGSHVLIIIDDANPLLGRSA